MWLTLVSPLSEISGMANVEAMTFSSSSSSGVHLWHSQRTPLSVILSWNQSSKFVAHNSPHWNLGTLASASLLIYGLKITLSKLPLWGLQLLFKHCQPSSWPWRTKRTCLPCKSFNCYMAAFRFQTLYPLLSRGILLSSLNVFPEAHLTWLRWAGIALISHTWSGRLCTTNQQLSNCTSLLAFPTQSL